MNSRSPSTSNIPKTARVFRRLQASAKLLSDGPLDLDAIGLGGREFLLRETGQESTDDLAGEIERRVLAASDAVEAALARGPVTRAREH